ncbi:hypothetical protein CANDROIZ_810001 [Candidatus Roizmanbacteria bacterium]|nr:hypothetical protein CANDROIZ_810001 [Candidatus Roizmanbacteria bacterium]
MMIDSESTIVSAENREQSHEVVVSGGSWLKYSAEKAKKLGILGAYIVNPEGENTTTYYLHENGSVERYAKDPQTKEMIPADFSIKSKGLVTVDKKLNQPVLKFTQTRGAKTIAK